MALIEHLTPIKGIVCPKRKKVVFRKFQKDGDDRFFLELDCNTLSTKISKYDHIEENEADFDSLIVGTKYGRLMQESSCHENIQYGGLTNVKSDFVLTIDLCPSSKPLDKFFFQELIYRKLTPIYVCVSGKWIENHLDELEYLKSTDGLEIFWVNHSYHHDFKSLDFDRNFMLLEGTNVEFEVIETEKRMLESELVPSIFFRFPGLRCDTSLLKTITNYALIPLGSKAWIAKEQPLIDGSIALVHANGNEPSGLSGILDFFNKKMIKAQYI